MAPYSVTTLVGSLRRESFSRKVALSVQQISPPSMRFEITEIGDLPLYNEDLEHVPPESWRNFREKIRTSDALLFVTPEYNRSIPAVLKNAIDVGSRPLPQNTWSGMPAGVISVSPGAMGAFGAHHHLRQSMVGVNMRAMPQPEAYLGNIRSLLDEQDRIVNAGTITFLQDFLVHFADWIGRNGKRPL